MLTLFGGASSFKDELGFLPLEMVVGRVEGLEN